MLDWNFDKTRCAKEVDKWFESLKMGLIVRKYDENEADGIGSFALHDSSINSNSDSFTIFDYKFSAH